MQENIHVLTINSTWELLRKSNIRWEDATGTFSKSTWMKVKDEWKKNGRGICLVMNSPYLPINDDNFDNDDSAYP